MYQLSGLYTDMYQLTMMQAYLKKGKRNSTAAFDYFFRKLPFGGGYVVFAGLQNILEIIEKLQFTESDIEYLKTCNFDEEFLQYLRTFKFHGDMYSSDEGEVVFPNEPLLTVRGNILECQLIETVLLNFLNFESLIATKAARMRFAAGNKSISEFGLRRAQSLGGIYASRAAIIGGCDSTSNVFAAKEFNIEPSGTMAHSFIQCYKDELTAFRDYASVHPDNCVLLVDTYNTLYSGIPNAITVAKELEKQGKKLLAIRLDSGDLAYLSKRARSMLDAESLHYVKIVASNMLDEYIIRSLLGQNAPIDIFGVGTSLVTGQPDAALDGIYKLAQSDGVERLKISETLSKTTLPGIKKLLRFTDNDGFFLFDAAVLEHEENINRMYHPFEKEKSLEITNSKSQPLLKKVMDKGKIILNKKKVYEIKEFSQQRLNKLTGEYKRFENPHVYKVGISKELMELRDAIWKKYRKVT